MKDIPTTTVTLKGKTYMVEKLEKAIDLSEHNESEYPTFVTHVIKGMDEDVYVAVEDIDEENLSFFFLYKVATNLFLSVDSEEQHGLFDLLVEIVFDAIGKQQ